MAKGKYTTNEIVAAYYAAKDGKTNEATRLVGSSVHQVVHQLDKYLKRGYVSNNTHKAYKRAYQIIRERITRPMVETVEAPDINGQATPAARNNLAKLEQAFMTFQEAIADVIVDEVNNRANQKIVKKEKEIVDLKEKYEKELQRLQAIIADAKDSSIIGLIKRKWNN